MASNLLTPSVLIISYWSRLISVDSTLDILLSYKHSSLLASPFNFRLIIVNSHGYIPFIQTCKTQQKRTYVFHYHPLKTFSFRLIRSAVSRRNKFFVKRNHTSPSSCKPGPNSTRRSCMKEESVHTSRYQSLSWT